MVEVESNVNTRPNTYVAEDGSIFQLVDFLILRNTIRFFSNSLQ